MSYKKFHPQEDYTDSFPTETLSNHACSTCDQCLWKFFSAIRLSTIIGATTLLSDFYLRDELVRFYRCAMQCIPHLHRPLTIGWESKLPGIHNGRNVPSSGVSTRWIKLPSTSHSRRLDQRVGRARPGAENADGYIKPLVMTQ